MLLTWKLLIMYFGFLLALSFGAVSHLYSQPYQGRLVDAESSSPIGYGQILTSDSSVVMPDEGGRFEVFVPQISVYSLGYLSQEITLIDGVINEIELVANPVLLSEVIVQRLVSEINLQEYAGAFGYLSVKALENEDRSIIANALNSQPGIYMHSGALNTNRITVRGIGARTPFSTNKVRAYFGDVPLTDGVGETTIEDIDMSAIGEVTVFKGPNSSIYGAGLGGAIQLQPVRLQPGTRRLYGEFGAGSYGLSRANLAYAVGTEQHELNVSYLIQTSDGYRDNNEFERNGIQLMAAWHRPKASYRLMTYYVNQFAEIPSSLNEDDYLNDPRKAAFTWGAAQGHEDYDKLIAGITSDHDLSARSSLRTTVYTQWRDANEPRPFNILDEDVLGYGLRSRYLYEMGEGTTVNAGFEAYQDRYDWQTYENLYQDFPGQGSVQGDLLNQFSEDRSFFNIFGEVGHSLSQQWQLTGGFNINRTRHVLDDQVNTGTADQSGEYSFDWNVSPRISIAYSTADATIYANASHGFSPPSLEETLAPDGTLNPDIQPETGWSYEVGTRGSLFSQRLSYDISLYTMRIRNLLVAQRVAEDQFVGINTGSTTHNGLEVGIHTLLWSKRSSTGQLRVNGSINDFTFKEFVDEDNDFSGNDLTGVPTSQWSMSLDLSFLRSFYGRLEFLSIGEMPITDSNSIYSDSYRLINTILGWKGSIWDFLGIDVSYRVNNLLDERYASMLAVNAGSFGGSAPRYYYPGLPIFHQVSVRFTMEW